MKITHIIAIILIAAAIGIIITSMGDASQYVSFKEAHQMAANGNGEKIHIVGELKKDATGNIVGMQYNPALDANLFSFVLVDEKGREETVYFYDTKPQDFERSEKIVIIGSVKDKYFVADKILMKCPSKYQGQGEEIREVEARQKTS
ncbi:MAG: cytochrome c maturation protein CcmE [Bacteroidota bacterium]